MDNPEPFNYASDAARDADRITSRRERLERYRSPLNIRTPKVDKEAAAKWFGVPPTQLDTAPVWRPAGTTIAF